MRSWQGYALVAPMFFVLALSGCPHSGPKPSGADKQAACDVVLLTARTCYLEGAATPYTPSGYGRSRGADCLSAGRLVDQAFRSEGLSASAAQGLGVVCQLGCVARSEGVALNALETELSHRACRW